MKVPAVQKVREFKQIIIGRYFLKRVKVFWNCIEYNWCSPHFLLVVWIGNHPHRARFKPCTGTSVKSTRKKLPKTKTIWSIKRMIARTTKFALCVNQIMPSQPLGKFKKFGFLNQQPADDKI